MKREFLKELRLTDEQIDKVMAENGKDIESAKKDYETLETKLSTKEREIKTLQGQLKTANKQIEDFEDVDIDDIKQKIEDYKKDYKKLKDEKEKEIEELQFNHILEGTLKGAKAKNIKAVKALLDLEGLKLNEGKIIGLDEQLESIKEENDYLFKTEEKKNDIKFTRPGKGSKLEKVTQEEFRQMGYMEKLELKNKDPELYKELK